MNEAVHQTTGKTENVSTNLVAYLYLVQSIQLCRPSNFIFLRASHLSLNAQSRNDDESNHSNPKNDANNQANQPISK